MGNKYRKPRSGGEKKKENHHAKDHLDHRSKFRHRPGVRPPVCRYGLSAHPDCRRADRLQALAKELHAAHGTECRIETADLSRAEECSRLCEVLADEHIDIFINNAGFGVCGSILETEEAREEEMIQVNVAAMRGCSAPWCARCTRRAAAPS